MMNENRLTEKESTDFLDDLFPSGLAGTDFKKELVPEGWENSRHKVVFHPSPEQQFKDAYRVIFQRIHSAGGEWNYHFPQLYLFRPPPIDKQTDDMESYDPVRTVAEEFEKIEREKSSKDLQEKIRQLNRKAADEAAQGEPPRIVAAYRHVYGQFPEVWPPV